MDILRLLSRVFHALWLQSQESALGVAAEALANSLTGHDDVPRRLALGTLHIVAASVLGAPLEKNVADAFMEAIGIMHYRVSSFLSVNKFPIDILAVSTRLELKLNT